jgi:hypothetical protein
VTKSYLQSTIDHLAKLIEEREHELDRLRAALAGLELLATLNKESSPKRHGQPIMEPKVSANAQLRQRILAVLREDGEANALRSGDIIAALGFTSKHNRQAVYSAIDVLLKEGMLQRDDERILRFGPMTRAPE